MYLTRRLVYIYLLKRKIPFTIQIICLFYLFLLLRRNDMHRRRRLVNTADAFFKKYTYKNLIYFENKAAMKIRLV